MAATKTKKRKTTRRKSSPPLGGTTYRVRDTDGAELVKPQPPANQAPVAALALLKAQRIAEQTPEPYTYWVERQTLFGDPVDLFMVQRDEHGVVRTFTLTTED